jgi:hypothetical protein
VHIFSFPAHASSKNTKALLPTLPMQNPANACFQGGSRAEMNKHKIDSPHSHRNQKAPKKRRDLCGFRNAVCKCKNKKGPKPVRSIYLQRESSRSRSFHYVQRVVSSRMRVCDAVIQKRWLRVGVCVYMSMRLSAKC